jgi:hypothetical protein
MHQRILNWGFIPDVEPTSVFINCPPSLSRTCATHNNAPALRGSALKWSYSSCPWEAARRGPLYQKDTSFRTGQLAEERTLPEIHLPVNGFLLLAVSWMCYAKARGLPDESNSVRKEQSGPVGSLRLNRFQDNVRGLGPSPCLRLLNYCEPWPCLSPYDATPMCNFFCVHSDVLPSHSQHISVDNSFALSC